MTDEELKKLALDLYSGKVFTSDDVRPDQMNLLTSIFMPLMFLDEKGREDLKDAVIIYEYYSEAGPRCINGKPMFMSFRSVHKDDLPKLQEYFNKYKNAIDSV